MNEVLIWKDSLMAYSRLKSLMLLDQIKRQMPNDFKERFLNECYNMSKRISDENRGIEKKHWWEKQNIMKLK